MSDTSASAATGAPAFETTSPFTRTWPARISARARSREAARPRCTTIASSLDFTMAATLSLIPAAGNPGGDTGQVPGEPHRLERTERAPHAVGRHAARGVETVERRIGRLAGGGVLAGRLAEGLCRFLDVEDVVHDLEGEPELRGERLDRADLEIIRASHHGAGRRRRPNQSAGLA